MKSQIAIRETKDLGKGKWKAVADTGEAFFFEPNGIVIEMHSVPLAEPITIEWETITRNKKEFKVIKGIVSSDKKEGALLPKTSVEDTPAPGGDAPVTPAKKSWDSEKMTKADWGAKGKSIETQAILKSVLESGMLHELTMNKARKEAYEELDSLFDHALEIYYKAKKGK